jgi:ribokinase
VRLAVVGHVEWVSFLPVDGVVRSGAILHSDGGWEEPGGGGGVAAVELARLGGRCTLFTGVGDDAVGHRLEADFARHGVTVDASRWQGPHRRAITLTGTDAERTIVVVGDAQHRRGLTDELEGVDAVYLCKGDVAAVRAARRARVLVATARVLPLLREAGVRVDALVGSASDPSERYDGDLVPAPGVVVRTEGAAGGHWSTADRAGRWTAAPLPGEPVDAYGCGDSFAAALTYALGRGDDVEQACAFAAERGAVALTRRGAHGPVGAPF